MPIAVLIGAGIANERRIREKWWLYKLRNGDEEAQQTAAERLGEMGSLKAVPELVRIMNPPPHPIVSEERILFRPSDVWAPDTLRKIGACGNLAGLPLWIDALGSEEPGVRLIAANAIQRLGTPARSAIPALVRAVRDKRGLFPFITYLEPNSPKSRPRYAAVSALWNLGPPGRTALSQALVTASADVRKDVESALSSLSHDQ